jgi:hypothetical protein
VRVGFVSLRHCRYHSDIARQIVAQDTRKTRAVSIPTCSAASILRRFHAHGDALFKTSRSKLRDGTQR